MLSKRPAAVLIVVAYLAALVGVLLWAGVARADAGPPSPCTWTIDEAGFPNLVSCPAGYFRPHHASRRELARVRRALERAAARSAAGCVYDRSAGEVCPLPEPRP